MLKHFMQNGFPAINKNMQAHCQDVLNCPIKIEWFRK